MLLLINFSLGLRIGKLVAFKVDDIDMIHHVVYMSVTCKSYKVRGDYGNVIGRYVYTEGVKKRLKVNELFQCRIMRICYLRYYCNAERQKGISQIT